MFNQWEIKNNTKEDPSPYIQIYSDGSGRLINDDEVHTFFNTSDDLINLLKKGE